MTNGFSKKSKTIIVVFGIVLAAVVFAWKHFQEPNRPESFASGNGRTEATEVDITTKYGGRLEQVLVNEGDWVEKDQILVRFDIKEMEAQLRRAEAEVRRAQQERSYAIAVIAQRKSELSLANRDLVRSKGLYETRVR